MVEKAKSPDGALDLEALDRLVNSELLAANRAAGLNRMRLEAAIATLASQAAFRLRTHKLLARRIGIFTMTNKHKPGFRRWHREVILDMPTDDSGEIITRLIDELHGFFSNEQSYHRLGVTLNDLSPAATLQVDLLGQIDPAKHDRSRARMDAIDRINRLMGKRKIYYAAEDLSKSWQTKHIIRSPRYVSQWDELPIARIV